MRRFVQALKRNPHLSRQLSEFATPIRGAAVAWKVSVHRLIGKIVPASKEWGSPRHTVPTLNEAVDDCNGATLIPEERQSVVTLFTGECANHRCSALDESASGEWDSVTTAKQAHHYSPVQLTEYVADLKMARVFSQGSCSMLILRNDSVVIECSHWAQDREKHPYGSYAHRRARLPKVEFLPGKSILLPRGADNYYHLFIDTLPQIALAAIANHPLDSFDYVLIPEFKTAFGREIMTGHLGVLPQKMVNTTDRHIECENLIVPTVFNRAGNWYVSHLKKLFLDADTPKITTERLYITRRNATVRRVINEEAVVEMLTREFGFIVLQSEKLTVKEQIQCFAHAEAVVGAHGAGLTNTLFCPPGTFVCEFRHRDHYGTASGCYEALASDADLRYVGMFGEGANQGPDLVAKSSDIIVDTDELRRVLIANLRP